MLKINRFPPDWMCEMANNGVRSLDEVRRKLSFTHDLISTAYHEAGHAICAILHFGRVSSIQIFPKKIKMRTEGACFYELFKEYEKIEDSVLFNYQLVSEVCFYYAGLTSEKFYYKTISGSDKFPLFLRDGSSNDTLAAAAIIKKYNLAEPGKKRYAFKQKLIKRTLNELQKYWTDITLLAHFLFKKKRLGAKQIKRLLTTKSINKYFWKEHYKKINIIFDNYSTLDENIIKSIILS